jgi:plastocyanin
MFRRLRWVYACAVGLVLVIPAWAKIDTVLVRNFEFSPATITINEGDTVVWHDIQGEHNVHHTGTPSLFGNSPANAPWFYQFAFNNLPPDSYHYVCTVHGFAGTVIIPHIDTVIVKNYEFLPASITIFQGDTVVWHDIEGFHNVHHMGTPSLFGNTAANAPWFYQFVFTLPPDSYQYDCQIHGFTGAVKVLQVAQNAAPQRPAQRASDYQLAQNYPNPFNSQTTIEFTVPMESDVRITVLDVLGQTVRQIFSGRVSSGEHRVLFNAEGLSSGLYFYRLEAPGAMVVRTMNFIK